MRGYFGIGVEGISKEGNVGNLVRSAHAFGASHFFSIAPAVDIKAMRVSDTSGAFDHMPYYQYESVQELELPKGCQLVGVELIKDSIELPSFKHPLRAAYVLGPEMGNLSQDMQARCDFTIHIPMKFCVNVGVAGALVMYDRLLSMGRFAERPARAGGPTAPLTDHVQGLRRKVRSEKP
ncbi:MAG: RNA methyltransferase [Rhodospirillales bacterium]|nr:RNA methyltransferase [Rhodospirillales bacterium]MCB9996175.1 RNA methyltransferase [Rhodospirillales bacterium]